MESNILKLINEALAKAKIMKVNMNDDDKNKSSYRPEAIIKKASELAVPAPKKYKEMLRIVPKNDTFYWQSEYINARFYLQAKFMENFEDDYAYYGEVLRYLPQYTDMSFPELRGYFTWRTKVRKGIVEKTSSSFVFVYIYELINGIGVTSPQNGFEKLLFIWNEYRDYDNKIDRYLKDWLKDYVIYYEMDVSRIKDIPRKKNPYLFALGDIQAAISEKNFLRFMELINDFSNYKILKSKFLKEFKNDYIEALTMVYMEIEDFYDKNRKTTLFEKMFGKESCDSWVPFRSGIFYENTKNLDRKSIVNDFERYVCENGEWLKYSYSEYYSDKRFIGEMLRTTEFYLRELYNYSYKITFRGSSKVLTSLIEKTVRKYCEEQHKMDLYPRLKEQQKNKKEKEKTREMVIPEKIEPVIIKIDTTKFDEIRRIAQNTQNTLIIEPIVTEQEKIIIKKPRIIPTEKISGMQCFSNHLTPDEKEIIKLLLSHQWKKIGDIAKKKDRMISVLIEAINEKALEHIDDNLIEINDENPWIYDEYKVELQEVI
ncbi:MAG: TerB N-terminal domain-containing protein [Eubacteriaceae bacterium]|nr:TerB N-terminal domain-containing protein [Eubacteriaceae bacterium]